MKSKIQKHVLGPNSTNHYQKLSQKILRSSFGFCSD
ncbi:hypothetical protein PSE_3444 [Pseudovibrio sp. FO-BEG1]|nr:hypothetical protein PSE_3444 [Pseudovibrio sp. FO-BEG1]